MIKPVFACICCEKPYKNVEDHNLYDCIQNVRAINKQLLEVCKTLREQLMWCGGSGDFGPGGQAHEGWQKGVVPALEVSIAAISAAVGDA